MADKLAAANAAMREGRRDEAIDLVLAVIDEDPAQPVGLYRELLAQLYQARRYEEGEALAARAVARFPGDFDLWNARGVVLRRAGRLDEAIAALDQASRIDPENPAALINRGNIHNDRKAGDLAEPIFAELVRRDPESAQHRRALGRALMAQRRYDEAAARFREAVALKPDDVDAWLDLSALATSRQDHAGGLAVLDEALAACPRDPRLLEGKAAILRRSSDLRAAETFLAALLPEHESEAWLHHQMARAITEYDGARADRHYARAVALDPRNVDYRLALVERLERSRDGDEGANLDAAYGELLKLLPRLPDRGSATKVATEVLIRLGDYERAASLGSFAALGRQWAEDGLHTALLKHLARVRAPADRDELVHQHRIWGEAVAEDVARLPIRRPAGPRPTSKIRLGIMSSDLRGHAVAYFAQPLFEFIDRDRFEVYGYSWFQGAAADATQARFAEQADAFRWRPELSDREAAQLIADDRIDMLLDLGGTTHMNKLAVMAFRPAPLSASWLGYPHSSGLAEIDHFVTDPHALPLRPELLVERPLVMPRTWIVMSSQAFPEILLIQRTPPIARNGFVTFGTANNTYKYGPEMLAAWAAVMRQVPGSRFLFVRPEGGSAVFRANMGRIFESHGVSADRLRFEAVRGQHMRFYNEIDISLDTFPLTGGTTTCESLWMGVPVVTLAGEATYERHSHSLLVNAGLADLSTTTVEDFIAKAVELAGDVGRITDLRVSLRDRLKASPLGQAEQFARDFYDLMAKAVEAANRTKNSI